jgi:hypothetical protein
LENEEDEMEMDTKRLGGGIGGGGINGAFEVGIFI